MDPRPTTAGRQDSWWNLHRLLFLAVACVGGLMLCVALTVPLAPLFALDVVLTEEEPRDFAKQQGTLAILEKANTNNYAFMFGGAGAVLMLLGGVGLATTPCSGRAA